MSAAFSIYLYFGFYFVYICPLNKATQAFLLRYEYLLLFR